MEDEVWVLSEKEDEALAYGACAAKYTYLLVSRALGDDGGVNWQRLLGKRCSKDQSLTDFLGRKFKSHFDV